MLLERHEIAWTAGARCADESSDLFFTGRERNADPRAEAIACCNAAGGCPVRRTCLAYAIGNTENYGTWGGMVERERRALARTACRACGQHLGRPLVAELVGEGRQHVRCPTCSAWVEVRPIWERPHRNNHVTGTGRRT